MPQNYVMGIDVGSSTSKCVILNEKNELITYNVVPVGTGTSGPKRTVEAAYENSNLSPEDIKYIVATGYGRNTIEFANSAISELSAHAKGASYLFENVRTVIDIGGQDAKALKISKNGTLESFVMNDKCAAGTGRFLDVMARVLEVEISDMGEIGLKSTSPASISSTCTVFAESEVISQLSKNVPLCDLIAGINRSVASRTAGLVKRIGVIEPIAMTGGVAYNKGVLKALEDELNTKIVTHPLAQLAGALGAAITAGENL